MSTSFFEEVAGAEAKAKALLDSTHTAIAREMAELETEMNSLDEEALKGAREKSHAKLSAHKEVVKKRYEADSRKMVEEAPKNFRKRGEDGQAKIIESLKGYLLKDLLAIS